MRRRIEEHDRRCNNPNDGLRGALWGKKRVDRIGKADIWNLLDEIGEIAEKDKRSKGGLSAANKCIQGAALVLPLVLGA